MRARACVCVYVSEVSRDKPCHEQPEIRASCHTARAENVKFAPSPFDMIYPYTNRKAKTRYRQCGGRRPSEQVLA